MKRIVRDFVTLFNVLWYRDFPLAVDWKERGRSAEWTTHIAVCVRSAADLLGYFTHFEAGTRTDAVIKDANGRIVANVEWEWKQPYEDGFNELEKLQHARNDGDFSALVTYSRDEHHTSNMKCISDAWKNCDEPLLLFLVRYSWVVGREFDKLETYLVRKGRCKKLRAQPALPWNAEGTRWAKFNRANDR
jgi:hypothetical protein